jgi:hypothetical protein
MNGDTRITTPCPTCGSQSLFVSTAGHLVCSVIGCKQPGVERAIEALKARDVESACTCSVPDYVGIYGELDTVRCLRCGRRPSTDGCIHIQFLRRGDPLKVRVNGC